MGLPIYGLCIWRWTYFWSTFVGKSVPWEWLVILFQRVVLNLRWSWQGSTVLYTEQWTLVSPSNYSISSPKGLQFIKVLMKISDCSDRIPVKITDQLYNDDTYKVALQSVRWLRLYFNDPSSVSSQPLPPICLFCKPHNGQGTVL